MSFVQWFSPLVRDTHASRPPLRKHRCKHDDPFDVTIVFMDGSRSVSGLEPRIFLPTKRVVMENHHGSPIPFPVGLIGESDTKPQWWRTQSRAASASSQSSPALTDGFDVNADSAGCSAQITWEVDGIVCGRIIKTGQSNEAGSPPKSSYRKRHAIGIAL